MRIKLNNSMQWNMPRARGLVQNIAEDGGKRECREEGSERLSGGRERILLELQEGQGPSRDKNRVSENTWTCLGVGELWDGMNMSVDVKHVGRWWKEQRSWIKLNLTV